jgi:hypothetical protein
MAGLYEKQAVHGSGKTARFERGRRSRSHRIAAGPFFQNTPFHAVAEMLREFLSWRGKESADEQLTQLESALDLAGIEPTDAVPLIAPLLNLPTPAKYPSLRFHPSSSVGDC